MDIYNLNLNEDDLNNLIDLKESYPYFNTEKLNDRDYVTVKTKHIEFIFSKDELLTLTALTRKDILNNFNVISITEPKENVFNDNLLSLYNNSLKLVFSDIRRDIDKLISETNNVNDKNQLIELKKTEITNEQIEQIKNFIIDNKDKKFIVHCSAGISRSSAIGMYIEEILNNDENERKINQDLILNHWRYSPNKIVYFKMTGKDIKKKEE